LCVLQQGLYSLLLVILCAGAFALRVPPLLRDVPWSRESVKVLVGGLVFRKRESRGLLLMGARARVRFAAAKAGNPPSCSIRWSEVWLWLSFVNESRRCRAHKLSLAALFTTKHNFCDQLLLPATALHKTTFLSQLQFSAPTLSAPCKLRRRTPRKSHSPDNLAAMGPKRKTATATA
jgi:hypothetical protein